MSGMQRTDLASEAHSLWQHSSGETTQLAGVLAREENREGFLLERVEILDEEGERSLGKPRGRYVTMELDALLRREEDAFPRACRVLASLLQDSLKLEEADSVLVVGLGNEAMTPDAVGPLAARQVMVTRHLKEQLPEDFRPFRSVAVFCSGVLGTTGLESRDLVSAAVALARPSRVIAVDALCACSAGRLCRSVQISDAGIVPGSGVGNARAALNAESLGVPVTALGVPTVVDAATLCAGTGGAAAGDVGGLFVTPRDIDARVRDAARLVGYGVNLAMHPWMSLEDIDMFLS